MIRNKGTFTYAANYEVKMQAALDPRMVVSTKADLINKETWPYDGDTLYVYRGLIVDCGEDGVYRLVDPTKVLNTDYSGWERIDVGGLRVGNIFTYRGSVETFEALPVVNNLGDVYNVEANFTFEGKNYTAGTNVAWNGTTWDPLAGSVDLSAYSTKEEVSVIRTNVATNTTAIENLGIALGATNAELAKKVDAVEGSSLIPNDKLALIEATAAEISTLKGADVNLDARLKTLEGLITDGDVDLDEITALIGAQESRIATLETESTTLLKPAIGTLQTQVSGQSDRITAAETLINSQQTQLTGISQRLTSVESYGTTIQTLSNMVGDHTASITNLTTGVSEAKQLAETKATAAYNQATAYADSLASNYDPAGSADAVSSALNNHISDTTLHITSEERKAWNQAQAAINTFLADADLSANAVDTLKELQSYIVTEGGAAASIVNRLTALEAIDHDAYKAADTALLAAANAYTNTQLSALGTASTKDIEYFATAAQGALAMTAAQQADTYTKTEVDNKITEAFAWVDVTI